MSDQLKHKWIYQSGKIIYKDEFQDPHYIAFDEEETLKRITKEHNAMAGIDDVAGFMEYIKYALNKAKANDLCFADQKRIFNEALALFPNEKQP